MIGERDLLAELHDEECAHGGTLRKLDELRDEASKVAHAVLAYDHAPEADKPQYRAELIAQARDLLRYLMEGGHVAS